jgi:hypothetical protein
MLDGFSYTRTVHQYTLATTSPNCKERGPKKRQKLADDAALDTREKVRIAG